LIKIKARSLFRCHADWVEDTERGEMSFLRRTLGSDEKIIYRTRYHWLYWAAGILLLALPVAAIAGVLAAIKVALIFLALTAFGVPFGLIILVRAIATEIAVTSDRFIKKSGLVSLESEDMSLDKIEEIDIQESFWGALLGYGTVEVHGSGTGSIAVSMVQSPERLRKEIETAREQSRRSED
jgi:hypothetical protein